MDGELQDRRRRRTHSPALTAFKAHVLQACSQPGLSTAVALSNGLNANLFRRWLNERCASGGAAAAMHKTQLSAWSSPTGGGGFVAVQLADRSAEAAGIRLALRRGPVAVSVCWPAQEAVACGAWLREWLR